MKTKEYLKEKIGNNNGFTLVEMLMVVFILVILTAMMVRILPTAVDAYIIEVDASNAQTFLSTTISELRDEFGTATQIQVDSDEKTVSYKSGSTGGKAVITLKDDGIYLKNFANSNDAIEQLLVSKAAATKNLHSEYSKIQYDKEKGIIIIEGLKVLNNKGNTLADLKLLDKNEEGIMIIKTEKIKE